MVSLKDYEVPYQELLWVCDSDDFDFLCTDELPPLEGFVGQDRAIRAIEFGLNLDKAGYNLFVTGLTGTGKASAIKSYVEQVVTDRSARGERFTLHDWCYVYNFVDADRPSTVRLPPEARACLSQADGRRAGRGA